jgi:acyl carrier protein
MSARVSTEATIVDILSDVLDEPAATLRGQPVVAAYNWDSVASLGALAQIESRLQVTLDLHRYHRARTIDDLVELVMNAVADKATAPQ